VAGDGPVFLRSYDSADGSGAPSEPVFNGAFTYDNALAAIALEACGAAKQARRIADALLDAAMHDRSGEAGHLRNAYRPGPVHTGLLLPSSVPPMGWWSAAENRWDEDPYQVGSATGNLAWTALALLTVADASGDARYIDGASEIARRVVTKFYDG